MIIYFSKLCFISDRFFFFCLVVKFLINFYFGDIIFINGTLLVLPFVLEDRVNPAYLIVM